MSKDKLSAISILLSAYNRIGLLDRAVPQRRDWFWYWLETGANLPGNDMCMAKRVLEERLAPYMPGSRETGDWMQFRNRVGEIIPSTRRP